VYASAEVVGTEWASGRVAVCVWALTLFPRGADQVIPQVLAVFLF
jgi:hypothetical protein